MDLMARVKALLRRSKKQESSLDVFRSGDVMLKFRKFEASKQHQPVALSPREFKILQYLIEHRGEVVSREQLLDAVWGYDNFPLARTVDMRTAKLRQKSKTPRMNPDSSLRGIGLATRSLDDRSGLRLYLEQEIDGIPSSMKEYLSSFALPAATP